MVVTRENNEIVIRIPDGETNLGVKELQELLDYFTYRNIISKSKASQNQIDDLAKEVNKSWWKENKDRFLQP